MFSSFIAHCSSIKRIERSTKHILPRIQVCMYVCMYVCIYISLKVSALLPSNGEKQSMNDVNCLASSGAKFAYIGKVCVPDQISTGMFINIHWIQNYLSRIFFLSSRNLFCERSH